MTEKQLCEEYKTIVKQVSRARYRLWGSVLRGDSHRETKNQISKYLSLALEDLNKLYEPEIGKLVCRRLRD